MAMELHKLSPKSFQWFTEVAAIRMLVEELKKPEFVNPTALAAMGRMMMEAGTAWVVKKDGEYIGAMAAVLVPNMYNPNLTILYENMWYVLPEYRKTRAGYLLLKELERAGEEMADETLLSILPSSEINTSALAKRGWIYAENAFRKVT